MKKLLLYSLFNFIVISGAFAYTNNEQKNNNTPKNGDDQYDPIKLTHAFEKAKGKLSIPVKGGKILQHHINTNSLSSEKTIDILAQGNRLVHSVFNGKVEAVLNVEGLHKMVLVSHGTYLSIYANLSEVFVRKGDKISQDNKIGLVFKDDSTKKSILHFQIWKQKSIIEAQDWVTI